MLAARYLGPNRLEPNDVPAPAIGEGEALVRVESCGFCGSDLGILSGLHPRAKAPLILGHEFCGRVVELGSRSSHFGVGDRIVGFPLISCGRCLVCRTGNPHVCRVLRLYGIDRDGGMAEYVKLPLENIIRVSDGISEVTGALIEPLAVAVHAIGRVSLDDAQTVVVIGAGPIGLLTALVLRARKVPNVLMSEVLPSRLALAEKLGFRAMQPGEEFGRALEEMTGGEGADVVFECAGVPATAATMTALVRCRGVIVNVGVFKKPPAVDLQALNFKEITLVGSRVYSRQDFVKAFELASTLPLEALVTDMFPLGEVNAAFDRFREGEGACKVIVRP
jgi:(R,R)-butanediol dehydrogenase / meso-butanediol dehydrogenase / diacetyl reductase